MARQLNHSSRTGVWNSLVRILWEFFTLLEVAKKIKTLTCLPEIESQSSRRQPVALLPRIITLLLRSNYWVILETSCEKVRTQTAHSKPLSKGDRSAIDHTAYHTKGYTKLLIRYHL